ncbi:MAG TPA: S9 family peptidase, partial [Candidatus Angelobacter sp.]
MRKLNRFFAFFITLVLAHIMFGQTALHYQKAPKPIPEILDAPPTPFVFTSPKADYLLVADRLGNPPIADLAQPMLRLAGIRINPAINGRHHVPRLTGLHLIRIQDGKEQAIKLPVNAYIGNPEWSPDGQHFSFTNTTPTGIELWVGDTNSAAVHRISGIQVNAILGGPIQWMPDNHTLLVEAVSPNRGNPPADTRVPDGPIIQESDGKKAPAATYEDLLQSAHDEDLFDYYATAQLTLVDIQSGKLSPLGKPAVFFRIDPSPDGTHILVARIHRPYSYLLPFIDFPKEVEVWDRSGRMEFKLASLPLAEHVPIEGVLTGPRAYEWAATSPATLVWAEALDGGDTRAKVPYHDHVLMLAAPFKAQPVELVKLEYRFAGGFGLGGGGQAIEWGENGMALLHDYDRNRRWTRTLMVNVNQPGAAPKVVWERSIRDRYGDPGAPLTKRLANGKRVIRQNGNIIFLAGDGASPKGEFPFLDRYDLQSQKAERIFRSGEGSFETVIALASDDGSRFITRYESPADPPNYFLRTAGSTKKTALTRFPDPAPQLRGITKQIVTYKRADGVPLSFTLYLPANYKKGEP